MHVAQPFWSQCSLQINYGLGNSLLNADYPRCLSSVLIISSFANLYQETTSTVEVMLRNAHSEEDHGINHFLSHTCDCMETWVILLQC